MTTEISVMYGSEKVKGIICMLMTHTPVACQPASWLYFSVQLQYRGLDYSTHYTVLPCKTERQYLLTLEVSRYCPLALSGSVSLRHAIARGAKIPASLINK